MDDAKKSNRRFSILKVLRKSYFTKFTETHKELSEPKNHKEAQRIM